MDLYPLAERKLFYRVLHAALMENTDLMGSERIHEFRSAAPSVKDSVILPIHQSAS
jgi:hypothetical protein